MYVVFPPQSLGSANPSADGTLDLIISAITEALTDVCVIERRDPSLDELRTRKDTWLLVDSGIACKLDKPRSMKQKVIGGAERTSVLWNLLVPVGTDIVTEDRVTVNAEYFHVIGADPDKTDGVVLTCQVIQYPGRPLES